MADVTQILSQIESGDPSVAEKLLPIVYEELRRLAAAKLAKENPGQTLQATALVHEAYLRLVDVDRAQRWDSRGHFFSAAAEAMRRVLIESARRKGSLKAGGGRTRIDLVDAELTFDHDPDEMLILDDALTKLEGENRAAAEVAKLRLFTGMTVDEASNSLGVSRRTGFRQWTYARAFLQVELQDGGRQTKE